MSDNICFASQDKPKTCHVIRLNVLVFIKVSHYQDPLNLIAVNNQLDYIPL